MGTSTDQLSANDGGSGPVQVISVALDPTNDGVTVTPNSVNKGTSVSFQDPNGAKLEVVFLSATGREIETITDTDVSKLSVGGCYHFKCHFTSPDGSRVYPKNGGVLDVLPHRP